MTMAGIGIGGWIGIAGVGTGVAGTVASLNASDKAQASNERAIAAEKAAERERNALEEARLRREMSKAIGTQRALLASAGADLTSGTAFDILAQSARDAEQDALIIRKGGELTEQRLDAQRQIVRSRGSAERTTALVRGANTLLSGIDRLDLFSSPTSPRGPSPRIIGA